jgi:hypothetical protein
MLGIAMLTACTTVACIVEDHHGGYGGGGGGGSTSTPPSAGGSAPAGQPLLVDVDTGKVMNATPGNGVGVFIEYASGGHWHVWWTCDTNVSDQSCAMSVAVSVGTGQITNAKIQQGASTTESIATTANSVQAASTTSTSLDGIDFDTAPGAIITVDAVVSGTRDGRFLFFVQNGQVNGGYQGTVTDPLELEPTAP